MKMEKKKMIGIIVLMKSKLKLRNVAKDFKKSIKKKETKLINILNVFLSFNMSELNLKRELLIQTSSIKLNSQTQFERVEEEKQIKKTKQLNKLKNREKEERKNQMSDMESSKNKSQKEKKEEENNSKVKNKDKKDNENKEKVIKNKVVKMSLPGLEEN